MAPPAEPATDGPLDDGSFRLLQRAQAGDRDALEQLMARYLPRLRNWASGRLPRGARDLTDTTDLVQNVLLQTFKRIETVHAGRDGGLQAYLRHSVMNGIKDEIRRAARRPRKDELGPELAAAEPSPLELAIGRERIDRYEKALGTLRPKDREAIIARVELGCTYPEVADMIGKPSANTARMAVERAMIRLIRAMGR
jgi:RNA polymerase sigma factor (sigma-70 family)